MRRRVEGTEAGGGGARGGGGRGLRRGGRAAAKLRAALASQMHSVLQNKVDLLLIPTALSLPCEINDLTKLDSTEVFANDVMTVPASLAGLPSVSVPVPFEGGGHFLAGLQLIGSRLGEEKLVRAAKALESMSNR